MIRRFLLLLIAAAPGVALADATPALQSYEAAASDPALQMLSAIFGSASGIFGGAANPVVDGMFLAFNTAILAIASAWFAWNITSAIASSSWDGEVLGKRYSTLWMPIRTVTGAAMLLPVWKGWNLAQLAMAYAASLGIGIGNAVYSHLPSTPTGAAVVAPAAPGMGLAVESLADGWRCVIERRRSQVQMRKTNVQDDPSLSVIWTSQVGVSPAGDAVVARLGAIPAADGYRENTCAQVEIPFPPVPADATATAFATAARAGAVEALRAADAEFRNLAARAATIDPDDPASNQIDAEFTAAVPAIIDRANAKIRGAVAGALDVARGAQSAQHAADAAAGGWLAAGGSYVRAAASQIQAGNAMPQQTQPSQPDTRGVWRKTVDNVTGVGSCLLDPGKCISDKIVGALRDAGGVAGLLQIDGANPIASMQRLASQLFTLLALMLAILLGLGVLSLTLAGAAGVMMPLTGMFLGAGIPIATLAVMLMIWPPLIIPFAWVFAIGAWLVVVIEALIAAPLWALVHLDPEGEGMGQRTTHGYIFLLNLLFRPAILVIAVTAAGALMSVLAGWGNGFIQSALSAMSASAGGNFLALVVLVGGVVVIYKLNMAIIEFAASLLTTIPTQVFAWLGGQFGSDVGNTAGATAGVGGAMAAAGATVGAGAMGARGLGRGGKKPDDPKSPPTGGEDRKFEGIKSDAEVSSGKSTKSTGAETK
ncbi:DotA/TraY family protein [Rhodocyclus tenuis]|uniref:DotA/TraY family protein n=1 Tax=Rhodocyclus tenuis TaxID=1066 RepID=A0A840G936_RHOTE|nr:DotA/TraY family protein [Rhodocyclus tenuis]MBB4247961.1 hypothetical protein [Rhodocyclus tenuis]